MVFDHHRESFRRRSPRGAFRHGPRGQYAVVLEPKIVMEMTCKMLLYAQGPPLPACRSPRPFAGELAVAGRLGTLLEMVSLAVLFERHYWRSPIRRRTGWDSRNMSTAVTMSATATLPNIEDSGIVETYPASEPASLLPNAIERNQTPIIRPTIRAG